MSTTADPLEHVASAVMLKTQEAELVMTSSESQYPGIMGFVSAAGEMMTGEIRVWDSAQGMLISNAAPEIIRYLGERRMVGAGFLFPLLLSFEEDEEYENEVHAFIRPSLQVEILALVMFDKAVHEVNFSIVDRRNDRPPKMGPFTSSGQVIENCRLQLPQDLVEGFLMPLQSVLVDFGD